MQASSNRLRRRVVPGCLRPDPQYAPVAMPASHRAHTSAEKMSFNYPRISVVIPSFNQGRFLGSCLSSLITQAYPNLDIIVVDGGSTDNSVEVIRSFEEHLSSWSSEADSGQASAINKGMAHASGDILCWLNSDDCLAPNALLEVAHSFDKHPSIDVVYGHRVLINESGEDVGRWILPYHSNLVLTFADFIPQETMFWRARTWQKVGAFIDESLEFAIDWDLICRFKDSGANFLLLPYFLGQFRLHAEQKTQSQIGTGLKEMDLVRDRYVLRLEPGSPKFYGYKLRQFLALGFYLVTAHIKWFLYRMKLLKIG